MKDQPLIYDFIEKKKNASNVIGFEYSPKHDLNVISFNGEIIPFVQLAKEELTMSNLFELLTKTLEDREEEEEQDIASLLELYTKTRQEREDEENKSLILIGAGTDTEVEKMSNSSPMSGRLFELYTKTEVKPESDEEGVDTISYFQNLFEFFTKTKEERESEQDTMSELRLESILFDFL